MLTEDHRSIVSALVGAFALVFACSSWGVPADENQEAAPRKTIAEMLPETAAGLFSDYLHLPAQADKAKTNDNPEMLGNVWGARRGSQYWLTTVLSPEWLPELGLWFQGHLRLIKDEFNNTDVTRIEWTRNGFTIRVAQTWSVMAITLIPTSGSLGWKTSKAMRQGAADLCAQLIQDIPKETLDILGKPYECMAPNGTMAVLLDASFDRATITECSDGLCAMVAGLPSWKSDDAAWQLEASRDYYWWRSVSWWTDGSVLGIHFIKKTFGPLCIDYRTGKNWFGEKIDRRAY